MSSTEPRRSRGFPAPPFDDTAEQRSIADVFVNGEIAVLVVLAVIGHVLIGVAVVGLAHDSIVMAAAGSLMLAFVAVIAAVRRRRTHRTGQAA